MTAEKLTAVALLLALIIGTVGCAADPAGDTSTNTVPDSPVAESPATESTAPEPPAESEPSENRTGIIVMGSTPASGEDPSSLAEPGMSDYELLDLLGPAGYNVECFLNGERSYSSDGVVYDFTRQAFDWSRRLTGRRTDERGRLTQLPVQVGDTLDEALDALDMTPLGDGYYDCGLEGALNARANEYGSDSQEILVVFPDIWLSCTVDSAGEVCSVGWYKAPGHTVMKERTSFRITDENLITADGVTPGMAWADVVERTGADDVSEGEFFALDGMEYRFDRRSDGQYHLSRLTVTDGQLPLGADLSIGDSLETVLEVLDITDLDPANPAFPLYGEAYGLPSYAALAYGADQMLRLEALTESGAQVYVTFSPDNRIVQADLLDPVAREENVLWYRVDDTTEFGLLSENVLGVAAVDDDFTGIRGMVLALAAKGFVLVWDTGAGNVHTMECPPLNAYRSLDYVGNGSFLLRGDDGQSCTLTYNPASGQMDAERSGV